MHRPDPIRRKHHLPRHLYCQAGVFFFTICTKGRVCSLASIVDGNPVPTQLGRIVEERWCALPMHHPEVKLDLYVLMPNHIHGLLHFRPEHDQSSTSVLRIVKAFKASATREARHQKLINDESMWQRDCWDHVVRHVRALERIRAYILSNPLSWHLDKENPQRCGTSSFYGWMEWYERTVAEMLAVSGKEL